MDEADQVIQIGPRPIYLLADSQLLFWRVRLGARPCPDGEGRQRGPDATFHFSPLLPGLVGGGPEGSLDERPAPQAET